MNLVEPIESDEGIRCPTNKLGRFAMRVGIDSERRRGATLPFVPLLGKPRQYFRFDLNCYRY